MIYNGHAVGFDITWHSLISSTNYCFNDKFSKKIGFYVSSKIFSQSQSVIRIISIIQKLLRWITFLQEIFGTYNYVNKRLDNLGTVTTFLQLYILKRHLNIVCLVCYLKKYIATFQADGTSINGIIFARATLNSTCYLPFILSLKSRNLITLLLSPIKCTSRGT